MKKIAVVFFLGMFLSGCATVYRVHFNGYLSTSAVRPYIPGGASFCVLENKKAQNPIFEAQIKSKIEMLLKERGYAIADDERADFYLSFVYGISPGRIVSEVTPVYHPGETGTVQTYTSTGKVRTSYVTYPGYTTYIPQQTTLYTSSLTVDVFDAELLRTAKEERKVWIGEAKYTSERPDIRGDVNYLLTAVFEYFGKNTNSSISINIPQDDPQLKKLLE